MHRRFFLSLAALALVPIPNELEEDYRENERRIGSPLTEEDREWIRAGYWFEEGMWHGIN